MVGIISFNIYHLPEYLYGASAGGSCHAPVAMAKHTSLDLTSYSTVQGLVMHVYCGIPPKVHVHVHVRPSRAMLKAKTITGLPSKTF